MPSPTPVSSALISPPSPSHPPPWIDKPVISGFDISLLSPLQLTCPTISVMKSSPSLSVFSVPLGAECLLCNSSKGSLRPLVPLQLCRQLFNLLHDTFHPGVQASQMLISARFVWPGLSHELGVWARSCFLCQQGKIQTHIHSTVPAIPVTVRRFSWVLFLPVKVSHIF